jgi:hypothetical protein
MDDQRPVSGAEKAFFSLGTGSGMNIYFFFWKFLIFSIFQVPVVLIFTKFDALEDMCYNKLRSQGKNHQEAEDAMHELANKIFQNEYLSRVLATDFPPKAYVCLAGNILSSYRFYKFLQILEMNKEENQCPELSEKTIDILDNDVLVNLFVSTQKNNLDLCIKRALSEYFIYLPLKYPL